MVRYDRILYDTVYLRALKSWQDGQPNLAHNTETKNKGKQKTKTEETVWAIVREGSLGDTDEH